MHRFRLLQNVCTMFTIVGLVFPQLKVMAAEPKSAAPKRTVIKMANHTTLDVKLGKDGALTGRVVSHNGDPQQKASVIVKQGRTEIATVRTDEQGNFSIPRLKTGVYQVASGATVGDYRVWSEKGAPPAAMPHCLLILGENGARGQYGLTETILGQNLGLVLLATTTGLALAATVIALQSEHEAREAKKTAAAALAKSP